MKLNEIYSYVYGSQARIDVSQVPDESKDARKALLQTTIRAKFNFIVSDQHLSLLFRQTLRWLNSADLEDLLYGNHQDSIPDSNISLCTDSEIESKFSDLDKDYKYFLNDENAKKTYIKFFKACKLIGDFVEKNNDSNNSLAFMHAYKLLVLFGTKNQQNPFAHVDTFITKFSHITPAPLHDALINPIAINKPPIALAKWQQLIRKNGLKAISIFQRAPEIEHLLNKVPDTLEEAQQIAAKLKYERYNEFPLLADLCIQYNLSEEIFNKCLSIKFKKSDQLPDISIDGQEIGYPGYRLTKLPVDDPRGFILGHITNCCQSMGGHSEQCVIDGITLQKNGFYVLLKAKDAKKEIKSEESKQNNSSINYNDYEIVGQGYAWLSTLNNLTFDSWENLTPSVEDAVIIPMLIEFSKRVTSGDSSILRVTIGKGGKTPDKFQSHTISELIAEGFQPEEIDQGYQYGDSGFQHLIYTNQTRVREYESKITTDINTVYGQEVKLTIYSTKHVEWIQTLFFEAQNAEKLKTQLGNNFNKMLSQCASNIYFVRLYLLLIKFNLTESFKLLPLLSLSFVANLVDDLERIYAFEKNILNDNIFIILVRANSHKISGAIIGFYQISPDFLSDECLALFPDDSKLIWDVYRAFQHLHSIKPEFATSENFKIFLNNSKLVQKIQLALVYLYDLDPKLLDSTTLKLLTKYAKTQLDIYVIRNNIKKFYQASPELLNEENIELVLSQSGYFDANLCDLIILNKVDPELISEKNFSLLKSLNNQYQDSIRDALIRIYSASPKLLNDKTRKAINTYPHRASDFADGLEHLSLAKQEELINDENIELVLNSLNHAKDIGWSLCKLNRVSPSLVNNKNRSLLAADPTNHVEDKIIASYHRQLIFKKIVCLLGIGLIATGILVAWPTMVIGVTLLFAAISHTVVEKVRLYNERTLNAKIASSKQQSSRLGNSDHLMRKKLKVSTPKPSSSANPDLIPVYGNLWQQADAGCVNETEELKPEQAASGIAYK